jgi:uncharacterized membrane protein YgcG
MLTALFGIEDGSLNLAVNLLILVLVVVWVSLIYWTWSDARRRINDPVLVTAATAASLFPFVGTIIYTILRPPEFIEDARERELEIKAAELRLRRLSETSCPRCEHPIELSWLRCPECQHRLKDPCRSCGRPVDPRWAVCPRCEAPVARRKSSSAPSSSREGARRRPSSSRPAEGPPPEGKRPSSKRPSSERASAERRPPSKAAPKRRSSTASSGSGSSSSSSSSAGSGSGNSSSSGSEPRRQSPAERVAEAPEGESPRRRTTPKG